MARLNDPGPSLDAVETLKRRFIRQNREIARVNSTQSIRIRNLETEISRLLAENLAIREQAINVAQKGQRARKSCSRCTQLTEVKTQLEDKVAEVAALVGKFGILEKSRASNSTEQRRLSGLNFLGQAGFDGASFGGAEKPARRTSDGWMPPIVEGKHYPRKTFDPEELKATLKLAEENTDSPELGPPPVAHFDVGAIRRFEPEPTGREDDEEESLALPPDLEKRRKRRASALLDKLPNSSDDSLLKEPAVTVRSAAGAKRKLSVRDDTEDDTSRKPQSEDFHFARGKTASALKNHTGDYNNKFFGSASEPSQSETSPRKALQPKTTNSPTKAKRVTVEDKLAVLKENVARQGEARRLLREKRAQATPLTNIRKGQNEKMTSQKDASFEPVDLPPTTPANLDVFSPASTEPSESRATAPLPEMQAMASVEDIVGNPSRPSRRPRGAVSYAEPNLRDKMRRPTKELAPAVTETDRFRQRTSSAQSEDEADVMATGENPGSDQSKIRTVVIKRENQGAERDWRTLPRAGHEVASPLVGKSSKTHEEDRRLERPHESNIDRTAAFSTGHPDTSTEPSVGNVGIPRNPSEDQSKNGNLNSALSKLSIFDGPASSPSSPPPSKTGQGSEEKVKTKTSSRRHSSNPAGLRRVAGDFSHIQQQSLPKKMDQKPDSRPDIMVRPSSAMERREAATKAGKLARVNSLRSTDSRERERENDTATSAAGADGIRRGERTMARRRSMMI
ncbi:MAG: hypothetical protein Q9160_002715 [Pyrenula sp. 1 TL-2023]